MGDRWMDDRDRQWRERDWRRSEAYGRDGEDRVRGEEARRREERTWGRSQDERGAPHRELSRGRPAYGEAEPDYGRRSSVTTGGAPAGYAGPDDGYVRSYRADRDRDERARYGYDRGHGEAGRVETGGREAWEEHREDAGDFLHRAGERISSWFRGDELMRGSRDEGDYEAHRHGEPRGHRGLGPKGYQRSDERISEEVHDRLTEDPWLDASHIEVEVGAGEVTLSGHVENREAKHRAERLIEDLSGVRHVQNNLRVDPEAGFTGAGRGFGSSAVEAEMRRNALSGRTGAGAAAERSDGVDPATGLKRN